MASPRRTLKDLGLAPSKARGQNFLSDPGQIAKITGLIAQGLGPDDYILEIGPGLGALTKPLLDSGANLWAVEYDRGLAANLNAWEETLAPRFKVFCQDILTFDPSQITQAAQGPVTLCGNLPYNISSPILFWLLNNRQCFSRAFFMLQKELADRLVASPGTKDYGRLTVALGLWFNIKTALIVPPGAFHPRPQVNSAVVAITPKEQGPAIDPAALGRLTAAAFAARRKTLFNNLGPVYGRDKVTNILAELGLNPGLRAEVLTPDDFLKLTLRLESDHD